MPEMRQYLRGPRRYVLAAALTLALGSVQFLLMPALRGRFPFLLLFPAIIVSSLAGGLGVGLLAVKISVLFALFVLLPPAGSLTITNRNDAWALGIFALVGVLAAVGSDRLRRSRAEAEAARAALVESEARLASRDVYKDRFLAVLAHELRQPLQAIGMASRSLRESAANPTQISGLIDRQVQQLTRLVSDLNDLTRIKEGRLHFEQEAFDVRDALDAAAETHREMLAERRVRFLVSVAEAPLPVLGDPARLQQVFSNLLRNAAQATPAGGTVDMRAERDAHEAVIRVRDTGVGIRPERLPEMFSLFVQDGPADSAHLGVGLALVQSIVTRHGGKVQARSDGPGQGAEFEVRLPCAGAAGTA
ncbi:sensor histidine kinase [Luteitalea pratensis]|nr:HAMP domain-containing sensor histidine kinase [Luteitalea pratensis]